eukprot:scaffold118386_cov35-Phaeocystis_antarctica.AAC.2
MIFRHQNCTTPIQKPRAYGIRSHTATTPIHTLIFFSYFTVLNATRASPSESCTTRSPGGGEADARLLRRVSTVSRVALDTALDTCVVCRLRYTGTDLRPSVGVPERR